MNFFTDGAIPVERIPRAVNGLLPPDIAVWEAAEAGRDFSARHCAKWKTYVYRIQEGKAPNPFTARYAWHIARPLDIRAMDEALRCIIGEHDFSSFRAAGGAPMSPVRTIDRAEIIPRTDAAQLEIVFHGNGFLYRMVRNLVGTLVPVGLGKISPTDFLRILEARDRSEASPTAPASGLCLQSVDY